MECTKVGISSDPRTSAGVGPGRTWMEDASGCGGGESGGGPLPSRGGPGPIPNLELRSTLLQENHLLDEIQDWGSDHCAHYKF